MARKAQKLTPIMVRLPAALHRALTGLAAAGGRSLNSEIVRRLEKSVAVDSPLSPDALRVLNRFEARIVDKIMDNFEGSITELAESWRRFGITPEEGRRVALVKKEGGGKS